MRCWAALNEQKLKDRPSEEEERDEDNELPNSDTEAGDKGVKSICVQAHHLISSPNDLGSEVTNTFIPEKLFFSAQI